MLKKMGLIAALFTFSGWVDVRVLSAEDSIKAYSAGAQAAAACAEQYGRGSDAAIRARTAANAAKSAAAAFAFARAAELARKAAAAAWRAADEAELAADAAVQPGATWEQVRAAVVAAWNAAFAVDAAWNAAVPYLDAKAARIAGTYFNEAYDAANDTMNPSPTLPTAGEVSLHTRRAAVAARNMAVLAEEVAAFAAARAGTMAAEAANVARYAGEAASFARRAAIQCWSIGQAVILPPGEVKDILGSQRIPGAPPTVGPPPVGPPPTLPPPAGRCPPGATFC